MGQALRHQLPSETLWTSSCPKTGTSRRREGKSLIEQNLSLLCELALDFWQRSLELPYGLYEIYDAFAI